MVTTRLPQGLGEGLSAMAQVEPVAQRLPGTQYALSPYGQLLVSYPLITAKAA